MTKEINSSVTKETVVDSPDSPAVERSAMNRLERRLLEAFDELWGDFVDPREPLFDCGEEHWTQIGVGVGSSFGACGIVLNEQQHRDLRNQCRTLALTNEFAINGHENRISFIVGSGHTYRATVKKGVETSPELAGEVQAVLDRFIRENRWHARQQEIVQRLDRDGEVFLRFFVDEEAATHVRFVEPDQVATPSELAGNAAVSFGIETHPGDVETVLAYYIDGQPLEASAIQHRKANVDANVKRGLPLFTPVRKNLRRAEKLLRNMSVVAGIQSAIALIRKHRSAVRSDVQQFVADQADLTVTSSNRGKTTNFRQYGPGTILDAPAGLEYDFPTTGIDAGSFVAVLQAELRAIASRLVMPEFMLTSDASNANYASTMVAEGPAVKMFSRLQAAQMLADLEVMWRVVEGAVGAGKLPADIKELVEIQVAPPALTTRDQYQEARTHHLAHKSGILSPQTWSQRLGLDYDQEQKNISIHREQMGETFERGVAKNSG